MESVPHDSGLTNDFPLDFHMDMICMICYDKYNLVNV